MKKILGVLLFGLASTAFAVDLELQWVHPTQNEDNSMIPSSGPGALESTRLEFGSCVGAAFGETQGSVLVPYPGTQAVIGDLRGGTVYCFRAFSINNFGDESSSSNVVSMQTAPSRPNPPTLSTTVNVVWEIKRRGRSGYTIDVVGTSPIGTECSLVSYDVNGLEYNELADRSNITFNSNPNRFNNAKLVSICA